MGFRLHGDRVLLSDGERRPATVEIDDGGLSLPRVTATFVNGRPVYRKGAAGKA